MIYINKHFSSLLNSEIYCPEKLKVEIIPEIDINDKDVVYCRVIKMIVQDQGRERN